MRRLRCLPRLGAFCTTPASCSWFLTSGVAALAPVALVPRVEMLDVPARMSSTVALHQRHYLIHWRPPVRDLLQVFVDQPLQTFVLVAVNIAPKGPLAYPEQPGLLLISGGLLATPHTPLQILSSESPATSSFGSLDSSSASNETGHITAYNSGRFICSLQVCGETLKKSTGWPRILPPWSIREHLEKSWPITSRTPVSSHSGLRS